MNEFENYNDKNDKKISAESDEIIEIQNSDTSFSGVRDDASQSTEIEMYSCEEPNEEKTDSYYYASVNESSSAGDCSKFVRTEFKKDKKKRYVSLPMAIAAMAITLVLSVTASAFISNIDNVKNAISKFDYSRGTRYTVDDNITTSEKAENITPATTTLNSLNDTPLSTPEIVDKVGPAVVGIINKTTYANAYGPYGYFGFFGGDVNEEIEQSSGSGVIISSDGYIITNNHVIENASKVSVILNNGEEYDAKIVGKDASTDLAVIKIDAQNLVFAQMGSSSSLRVGETAIAIGNPLGQEFAGTTTQGIISGLNRSVTIDNRTLNLIQTDAAINPGNSGGALVNEYGHLIGINTAKISSDALEGLGFAIPIDEAKPIIQELITNGYVTGRPVIGIGGRAVTKEDAQAYNMKIGVYVSSLTPSGPAHMAGVQIGDIIVECEGEPVETVDDINELKNKKSPGDELKIKVYRVSKYTDGANYVDISIILGEESPGN